jgi:hypothetical protein
MTNEQLFTKVYSHLAEMMNNPDCENYINIGEVNANEFFHTLATKVPALIYAQLTEEEIDLLTFNHITNRLIMQFSKIEK